ncbi:MAG TPA: archaellin/type IV pilin N-terminal domain-containing protein [Candidatus Bathyarchaeia archaeon]|nr:archaellin/type IV pilin N-terminal domain-containing protein [Candidatus Bathyarchaeia archaeon]
MWKIIKSKKALSPVIAAVILIGVTIAISVAVGAWTSALTFNYMKTEELKIISHTWSANNAYIDVYVKNTGSAALTVQDVRVNDVTNGTALSISLSSGQSKTVTIIGPFISGAKYEFALLTATGNKFTYAATAP